MDLTRTTANISDDRRVVLTALREVPEEITFLLSEAKQDETIPNRYWFDFPNQWANQPNKDPIIGIRSIYTTNTNRFIKYKCKVSLYSPLDLGLDNQYHDPPTFGSIETTLTLWLDGNDTIRPITENFNKYWLSDGNITPGNQAHEWKDWEIQSYYGYDRETQKTNLCFGRGIDEDNQFHWIDNDYGNVEYLCDYVVEITPLSDDAKALFGETIRSSKTRVEIELWSRHQCLVKSSIAANDKNNILGHTRDNPYNPIKYYRLNSRDKKFWIELYETRFHDCRVVIPKDKKNDGTEYYRDDSIIEAIVAFSAQGMI